MPVSFSPREIRSRICLRIWQQMVRLCKNNIEVLEDGFCYLVFRQIAKTLEIPVNIDRDLSGAWYPFPNLYIINQLFNGFPV